MSEAFLGNSGVFQNLHQASIHSDGQVASASTPSVLSLSILLAQRISAQSPATVIDPFPLATQSNPSNNGPSRSSPSVTRFNQRTRPSTPSPLGPHQSKEAFYGGMSIVVASLDEQGSLPESSSRNTGRPSRADRFSTESNDSRTTVLDEDAELYPRKCSIKTPPCSR